MAQFKVDSDILDGFKRDDIINDVDMPEGTNVDALVEGGFLVPQDKKTTKPAQAEMTKDTDNG